MSDAKLKEGIERILQTPTGLRVAVLPPGMLSSQVFELASAVERFHAHARAIGVSEDRARGLLEGEMVKARVRADFTSLDAVTSAERELMVARDWHEGRQIDSSFPIGSDGRRVEI